METNINKILDLIKEIISSGRTVMLEPEAKSLISMVGIPTPNFNLVQTAEEAQKTAESFGYPIVLKIASPDILHKSDVGGVKVNLNSADEVFSNFNEIKKNVLNKSPNAAIHGVLVQKMAPSSTEIVIGAIRDAQFGPAVMFGLGGIFIELLKDVSFRITPIIKEEALEMIKEIKGYQLLEGYRGSPKLDIDAIAETIVKVSDLIFNTNEISQIDLNPIMVYQSGLLAVDARIILNK
jgi:acetyl-CoA synthetase (ADP-forming)